VILKSNYGKAEIWTFAGDRINRTLAKLLTHSGIGIATSSYQSISIKKAVKDQSKLNEIILAFLNDRSSIHKLEYKLSKEMRLAVFSKFVKCLPDNLWYEALAERIFDFDGLITELTSNKIELIK
jgi:hypothetical protein